MFNFSRQTGSLVLLLVASIWTMWGCGTTKQRNATEQLLLSDAVDRTISQIDFSSLSGTKVYFDMQYIAHVKAAGFVNAPYIISSLRQQMISQHCHLVDNRDEAEYIVEARVGALGADAHDVIYGIPANNSLNAASSLMPTLPALPTIPELSIAKRSDQFAAAKIGVFAYNRTTFEPVWKSGITQSKSTAKDTWIFGMGPFQRGTIYGRTQFAGSAISVLPFEKTDEERAKQFDDFASETHFKTELELKEVPSKIATSDTKKKIDVVQVNHEASKKIEQVATAEHKVASNKTTADKKPAATLQKVDQPPKLLTPPAEQSLETKREKTPRSNSNIAKSAG